MTTDELRAWMKALEERDTRIVALEKRLQLLELSVYAQALAKPEPKRWSPDDPHVTAEQRRWFPDHDPAAAAAIQGEAQARAELRRYVCSLPDVVRQRGMKRKPKSAEVRAAEAEADRLAGPELMSEYRAVGSCHRCGVKGPTTPVGWDNLCAGCAKEDAE